jgi:uncharacterized protein
VSRLRIAVVGSGVAGLTAAHILQRAHDVTLFERDGRLGGHAHTHAVPTSGGDLALDTGFLVHNERTYPSLIRLFGELGVQTQESDMSFSVRCEGCGLEYAGARGLGGVLASAQAARPRYARMLLEVKRFHRAARRVLADPGCDRLTIGAFLREGGYSDYFAQHFLLPLTGAIWSCAPSRLHAFPARYLFRFFQNHGMLSVFGSPCWRTVAGGSRTYVDAIAARLPDVRLSTPVTDVERRSDGVLVRDGSGEETLFDRLVLASHPDQALALLSDPSADERRLLGAFSYSRNDTVLHTDGSLLPRARAARASWNYLLDACATTAGDVHVTYHLNRLQALRTAEDYCVTLNVTDRIAPGAELARMVYEHPAYTVDSPEAQRGLAELAGHRNTVYCGAYHGWGFHEDGCVSGVRAAAALGVAW